MPSSGWSPLFPSAQAQSVKGSAALERPPRNEAPASSRDGLDDDDDDADVIKVVYMVLFLLVFCICVCGVLYLFKWCPPFLMWSHYAYDYA